MTTTRTDACISMAAEGIERYRSQIDENQYLQDCNLKVKFKRGWPFRIIVTLNFCHERGD